MSSTDKVLGTINALTTLIENFPMSILDLFEGKRYTSIFDFLVDVLMACGVPVDEWMKYLLEKILSVEGLIENGIEDLNDALSRGDFKNRQKSKFFRVLEDGIKGIIMTLLASFYGCSSIPIIPDKVIDYPDPSIFSGTTKEIKPKENSTTPGSTTVAKTPYWDIMWREMIYPAKFEIPAEIIDLFGMLNINPTSREGNYFYDVDGKDVYYEKVEVNTSTFSSIYNFRTTATKFYFITETKDNITYLKIKTDESVNKPYIFNFILTKAGCDDKLSRRVDIKKNKNTSGSIIILEENSSKNDVKIEKIKIDEIEYEGRDNSKKYYIASSDVVESYSNVFSDIKNLLWDDVNYDISNESYDELYNRYCNSEDNAEKEKIEGIINSRKREFENSYVKFNATYAIEPNVLICDCPYDVIEDLLDKYNNENNCVANSIKEILNEEKIYRYQVASVENNNELFADLTYYKKQRTTLEILGKKINDFTEAELLDEIDKRKEVNEIDTIESYKLRIFSLEYRYRFFYNVVEKYGTIRKTYEPNGQERALADISASGLYDAIATFNGKIIEYTYLISTGENLIYNNNVLLTLMLHANLYLKEWKYRIKKDFDNIRIIKNFGDLGKALTDYTDTEIINEYNSLNNDKERTYLKNANYDALLKEKKNRKLDDSDENDINLDGYGINDIYEQIESYDNDENLSENERLYDLFEQWELLIIHDYESFRKEFKYGNKPLGDIENGELLNGMAMYEDSNLNSEKAIFLALKAEYDYRELEIDGGAITISVPTSIENGSEYETENNEELVYKYNRLTEIPKKWNKAKRLSAAPTTATEDSPDLIVVYEGVNPNELYKTYDMNAFIWYVLNKSSRASQIDINHTMWDSRLKYSRKYYKQIGTMNEISADKFSKWYNSKKNANDEFKYIFDKDKDEYRRITRNDAFYPILQLTKAYNNTYALNVSFPAQKYYKQTYRNKVLKNEGAVNGKLFSFNGTIYQFNSDYLYSIEIFKPRLILAGFCKYFLGLTTDIVQNANFDISKNIINTKLKNVAATIIMADDTEVEDCYTSFSNDEFNAMLEEMLLSRNDMSIQNTRGGKQIKKYNKDDIFATLDSINASATKEEHTTKLSKGIVELDESGYTSVGDINFDISTNFNSDDYIRKLLWAITMPIVEAIFTPQLMLLIIINMSLTGQLVIKDIKDLNKMVTTFINLLFNKIVGLLKSIIKYIKDLVVELLLEFILKKLLPLITKWISALQLEKLELYVTTLIAAIKCLPTMDIKLTKLGGIDDVNYADITDTGTTSNPEAASPC